MTRIASSDTGHIDLANPCGTISTVIYVIKVITASIPRSAAHRLADRRSLTESGVLATEAMKQVFMATLWQVEGQCLQS
jgi:hypothetical protein